MTSTIPTWLAGVWKRLSLETEDGRDTTTQVIYLQTPSCYGDLRIPVDRPELGDRTSLTDLTTAEILALSKQQGFSGIAIVNDNRCQWHRYIDYQPPTPFRDIGTLQWDGELWIEEGIDAPYREEWQKIDDGNGDFSALVLPSDVEGRWKACIVTAGDWFVYSRNRLDGLPNADSLETLVTQTSDLTQQQTLLDCEISVGRCASGQVPWEIQQSTLPWREGQALWAGSTLEINLSDGHVVQTVNSPNLSSLQWDICAWGTGKVFGIL
jgi:hypothetical protein